MDPTAPPVVGLRPEKVVNKIPGRLTPLSSRDKEGYIDDLASKSIAELKELRERQEKILSNKSLLSKLKDKGSKAAELKQRIELELTSRQDVDTASDLMAQMSLSQLNALEWTGRCRPGCRSAASNNTEDDADCEESDPLKIIATHSGVSLHQKQLRVLGAEESLVTENDMAEVKLSSENKQKFSVDKMGCPKSSKPVAPSSPSHQAPPKLSDEPEPFALLICGQYGHHKEGKNRFKPNKPIKPFTGAFPIQPPGRISSKINRLEETNVTPPLSKFSDAKLLSLDESIELQRQQARHLKDVQMKHAAQKLLSLTGVKLVGELPPSVLSSMAYRKHVASESESDNELNEADLEAQELHDDENGDRDTTVVYSIMP